MPEPLPVTKHFDSLSGEGKVWLCGLGLVLGIAMTAGLLLLVLVQGVSVFWPKPVVQFQTKAAEGAKPQTLAGEIRKRQIKRTSPGSTETKEEWLVFIGNKDANGNAFRFFQPDQITDLKNPEGVFVAERMEYGDSIFYPKSLKLADGKEIAATDAGFTAALQKSVDEGNGRREEIMRIEKDQIGAINQDMTRLDIAAKGKAEDAAGLSAIAEKRRVLQAEYEKLAAGARALRERQSGDLLHYTLADGTERSQPVSDILNFHQPNTLGLGGKLSWFLRNVWDFLIGEPREANTEGGIFPAIFGTFVMTVLMSLLVTPLGVVAAIYLREYARQGIIVRAVRISVNNLAGVPSIVFGVFGLGFFVYMVGGGIDQLFFSGKLPTPTFGTGGILWASLTLALLTLPVVIVATEEALSAVPRGVREAALACGASKWQSIQRVVLPSSLPGILTGVILSMARGAGEVAPLMLVGVVKLAPSLPIDLVAPFIHAERKFMHLGFHIYDLGFQSPDSEAAKPMVFATTLFLISLVIVMNIAAITLRNHLRRKYAASTF
jgi:phosphate transport system permease protein